MSARKVPNRRPLAIKDVAEHANFIAESSLEAALRFLDAIEETVTLLSEFPKAGGVVPTGPDVKGLRAKLVSGFSNHVVLYLVTSETIDILRVIRGGKDFDDLALQLE